MIPNHQATFLIDASKRFLKCRDDYETDEEFQLVLDLGMYLRQTSLWEMLSVSDENVSVKEYKKIVKRMAKAGVENTWLMYDENGKEFKRIIDRLAET